ncbi:hypothetical protein R1flu_027553 [Riccia fluitans]|uniref:Ribosomal protein L20 n=1 Tax=Riccia fluitans TaxID=41844 RepID=A0ABD1XJM4_9MARC
MREARTAKQRQLTTSQRIAFHRKWILLATSKAELRDQGEQRIRIKVLWRGTRLGLHRRRGHGGGTWRI